MTIIYKNAKIMLDPEDYSLFKANDWFFSHGYLKHKSKSFHREVLKLTDPKIIVDHINMNKLDNRKRNLRISTKSTNAMNRNAPKQNTSGYKGVSWRSDRRKWRAYIVVMGRQYYLGEFDNKKDAALAYNAGAIKYHKEFARLNEIK